MSSRSKGTEDETPLSPVEMQALHRLAEPLPVQAEAQPDQLWASRYRIKEKVGKGGMGDVYLAHDVVLDRYVALKVLRKTSDESFVDETRLLHEARAAAKVEHERLARIYDALTWNDQALIAMEYVRGETLRDWMKAYRPTMTEIVTILQQVLEGLQVLHESGLYHRDLKPENIMVTADGNLRILDLGIARRVALADTVVGSGDSPGAFTLGFGVGTPGYMAPEQWQHGEIDARADLFALGVIAYELVLGRQPFCGSTNLDIREQTLNCELSFTGSEWKDVPAPIKSAVQRALARDPAERFQSVADMARTLVPLFRPTLPPISGPRSHPIRPPGDDKSRHESLSASVVGMSRPPVARRSRALIAAAGLVLAAALTVGILGLPRKLTTQLPPTQGMVRFAGGSFTMGNERVAVDAMCAEYPRGCPPEAYQETPPRRTTVAPFELDEREVTNEEFARFLTSIGPSIRIVDDSDKHYRRFVYYALRANDDLLLYDLWQGEPGIDVALSSSFQARAGLEKHPAVLMTWLGARLYCKSVGKRLPTEAEWEFAARGVENRAYPWGNEPPDCARLHLWTGGWLNVAHPEQCDDAHGSTTAVMRSTQDVTPDGVHDMGGNVLEWVDENERVNDDEASYVARLSAESLAVFRGGAYDATFMIRSTSRNFRLAFNEGINIGFRCAKSISISNP